MKNEKGFSEAGYLMAIIFTFTCIASWITHIVVCIDLEKWGLLIAGAIMFPIGIIHGIGIWFGAW